MPSHILSLVTIRYFLVGIQIKGGKKNSKEHRKFYWFYEDIKNFRLNTYYKIDKILALHILIPIKYSLTIPKLIPK